MIDNHSDGVAEAVDDVLRQALMIAARLAEVAARSRQEQLRQARAQSEREGRDLARRFEAEHAAARASLLAVRTDQWWQEATPDQIGAAYKTATSWAGQDAEIAETRKLMDERLAERGIVVTPGMPGRVSDLIQAREWAARTDPLLDGEWTREMSQARTTEQKERLNAGLVAAWLATPEGQQAKANQGKDKYELATEWVKNNDPEFYRQWQEDGRDIDTSMGLESRYREIIRYWEQRTGGVAPAASPEAAKQAQHKADLAQAEAWAKADNPERYRQWSTSRDMADTVESSRGDERTLIAQWKEATGQAEAHPGDPAAADVARAQADQLRGAANHEADAANEHELTGDRAQARAIDWEAREPEPDLGGGPSAEDLAWFAQEQQREEESASYEWDSAERRAEFAHALHGVADQKTVDARILADMSQGTHPSQAVRAAPRNAPRARPNQARANRNSARTKGSR